MSAEEMSFEAAFARLEETVRILERGDLALAEMVAVYEEGVRLSEHCTRLLDAAELRVARIMETPAGRLETIPLDVHSQDAGRNADS